MLRGGQHRAQRCCVPLPTAAPPPRRRDNECLAPILDTYIAYCWSGQQIQWQRRVTSIGSGSMRSTSAASLSILVSSM